MKHPKTNKREHYSKSRFLVASKNGYIRNVDHMRTSVNGEPLDNLTGLLDVLIQMDHAQKFQESKNHYKTSYNNIVKD